MDELFEVLTLIQTQKIKQPKPIVLFGSDFWKKTVNFNRMIEQGTINESDLDLFEYHDSVQSAYDYIVSGIQLT